MITYITSKIIAGIAVGALFILWWLLRGLERRDEEQHESDWV